VTRFPCQMHSEPCSRASTSASMALALTVAAAVGLGLGLAIPQPSSLRLSAPSITVSRPVHSDLRVAPTPLQRHTIPPITAADYRQKSAGPQYREPERLMDMPTLAEPSNTKTVQALLAFGSLLMALPLVLLGYSRRNATSALEPLLPMTRQGHWAMASTSGEDDDDKVVQTEWKEVKADKPAAKSDDPKTSATDDEFEYLRFSDPVAATSRFVGRRFGLAGGLAFVGAFAAIEGNEILQAVLEKDVQDGTGEVITTSSGLQYVDIKIGGGNIKPEKGFLVGGNFTVSTPGGVEVFTTRGGRPIAFKYQERPFTGLICQGVEEGVTGMKKGSIRRITVPPALGFGDVAKAIAPGVDIPPNSTLVYEIELVDIVPFYT